MNKKLLALLVASSFSLYGCGDEQGLSGTPTIDPDIKNSLNAETKIAFDLISDPNNPVIIKPTFLAMDQKDGTLSVDDSASNPANLADPQVALGKADGWSTTQPIVIDFTGNDLDANTAANGFVLIKSGDPTNSADSTQPVQLSAADGDFMVRVSGKTLTVLPLKPLDPASNYMFAVTNDLKDAKGNPVGMTNTYAGLKSNGSVPSEKLVPAQAITHAVEQTIAVTTGVAQNKIIYSSWFTTTSAGDVLFATKGAIALAAQAIGKGGTANAVWKGTANPNNVDTTGMFTFTAPTALDITGLVPAAVQTLYSTIGLTTHEGTVSIPYFLNKSDANDAWMTTPWQSGMPSLAKITHVLKNGTDADKAAIAQQLAALTPSISTTDLAMVRSDADIQKKVISALTGAKLTLANGSQLDPERLITQYSPIPQLKSMESVPYTLVMPALANCGTELTNQTGIPVTMYQHGITGNKDSVLALAPGIIDDKCMAMIAIDHPLHGSRGIKDSGDNVVHVTSQSTPDVYMNLAYLNVARDNFRESIIDTLSLRTALGLQFQMNQAGSPNPTAPLTLLSPVDKTGNLVGVSYIGHSLGAMTGIGFTATANKPVTTDTALEAGAFTVNRAEYANPGAGIAYLLLNSDSFGPLVKSKLLASRNELYKTYSQSACITPETAQTCFDTFVTTKMNEAQRTELFTEIALFAYAAQSVLDTVDPINLIGQVSDETQQYMTMVVDDSVIPNGLNPQTDVIYSPFGGTLPLINSGFEQFENTVSSVTKSAGIFVSGNHSSIADPAADPATTTEMQAQAKTFLTEGNITVSNSSLMTTMP
ncbi:Ig-like domain-containing protein [Photobacterium sp. WH24]|uniref:VolA/Pla-1 family phospholipase n=1 Tax=Photobacterium sp. WH24 TaxID=2827237 RepID=UPI001C46AB9C|nr:VolA/Pla-1 family phospholipase [Photobacterium sp. WH24]MBV7260680.1 Ig-like domain-containing protein [Photobacterium sp. WH24]